MPTGPLRCAITLSPPDAAISHYDSRLAATLII